jgi:23S rRNA pseudouridine2457 synthase
LIEGKNHQVRKMTAAIGHPTLRLIRVRIGELELGGLGSGKWRELGLGERAQVFAGSKPGRNAR